MNRVANRVPEFRFVPIGIGIPAEQKGTIFLPEFGNFGGTKRNDFKSKFRIKLAIESTLRPCSESSSEHTSVTLKAKIRFPKKCHT